ncbi:MAG: hypothetical protein DMG34_11090 [Acidobacteria bacterium]|nr:MAG: hypothetical protein DMG34_11090 [Acidobacteriota bacterium]
MNLFRLFLKFLIRDRGRLTIVAMFFLSAMVSAAQDVSPDAYSGLRWRFLGTHRGGRITTVAGVTGQPNVYYAGTPNGGVWKTVDDGRTWKPIFDAVPVASIGALAVAPSNPNIIYVATGEQARGRGVFKSTDAGATWSNAGLAEEHFISSIVVDPKNPDIVIAGAFGSSVPTEPRGLFKTINGGKSWTKTLADTDGSSGVADIEAAPEDARILYAALNPPPGEPGQRDQAGDSRVYLSTDEGSSWKQAGTEGLPARGRGRIGLAVIPGTSGRGVFAIMNQGLYRSNDSGATWQKATTDPRILGSWYFSRVFVDPNHPEVVYVMQTCTYRSNDGGKTFFAFRGAPSGEDHHILWIAPDGSNRMILGTDQGAIISVNGGETWTDWLNQPTGQLYHVTTDNTFPYHAYAAQQDSGTIVVPNRSDYGQITYRDWFSTGGFESGYIAPDPLNPNLIYSIGWFGTVFRLDRTTGQIATVFVPPANYQTVWETPLVYDPRDPHTLYYGSQYLLKTSNGAVTWDVISQDLSSSPQHPAEAKKPAAGHEPDPEDEQFTDANDKDAAQFARNGSIHTIAPSPIESGMIWVGTSNGLVHLFRAGTWNDVSPPDLPKGSDVRLVEASPHDANKAYAVVLVRRDPHPYLFRTHDAGKTWTKIVTGLPEDSPAEGLREDTQRKGLLFAGTETAAWISFDDGNHWQSLQLNMPTTDVTDFAVHGADLVASTFGRGLWILDDISPLREADAKLASAPVRFYKPQTAMRVRWDNHEETPLSPEFPGSRNPPDGAILYYCLKDGAKSEITLDLLDSKGNRIRHYSSKPPASNSLAGNAPDYWFAPPSVLSTTPGLHRFVWDVRAEDPLTLTYGYFGGKLDYVEYTLPDHSVPGQTPRQQPPGALLPPGAYEAVLTVDGKQYRQKIDLVLDPRVHASASDLIEQWNLAYAISMAMEASYNTYNEYAALQTAIVLRQTSLKDNAQAKDLLDALAKLQKTAADVAEGSGEAPGIGPMNRDLSRYLVMIESADMRPAASGQKASQETCVALQKNLATWLKLNDENIPAVNKQLEGFHLAGLPLAHPTPPLTCH